MKPAVSKHGSALLLGPIGQRGPVRGLGLPGPAGVRRIRFGKQGDPVQIGRADRSACVGSRIDGVLIKIGLMSADNNA